MIFLNEYSVIDGVSEHCPHIGISPDGRYLALVFAGSENIIQLCDVNGRVFNAFQGHRNRIQAVAFAADGRTIASASADKTVRIWSPTGDLLTLFDRFDDSVDLVRYAPGTPILAAAQIDGRIVLFDIAGNFIVALHNPHGRIHCLDWSADSGLLAAACADSTLYLFDTKTQTRAVFSHPGAVYSVSLAKDSRKFVTGCEDGRLRFFNIVENKTITVDAHRKRVTGIGFAPDDSFAATASLDKTIKFFDRYGDPKGEYGLNREALGLQFSPDGKRLFVITRGGYLHIFDIEIGY